MARQVDKARAEVAKLYGRTFGIAEAEYRVGNLVKLTGHRNIWRIVGMPDPGRCDVTCVTEPVMGSKGIGIPLEFVERRATRREVSELYRKEFDIKEAIIVPEERDVDAVIDVIDGVSRKIRKPDDFEAAVNPLLKPYRVYFTQDDGLLNRVNAPGRIDKDGTAVLRTPGFLPLGPSFLHFLHDMLSHEFVHRGQLARAQKAGGLDAMWSTMWSKFNDKAGNFSLDQYAEDKQEIMAFAMNAAQELLRSNRGDVAQSIDDVRTGRFERWCPAARAFPQSTAGKNLFRKYLVQYLER